MSGATARAGQIALGALWLADGALQFQPYMFGRSFVTGVLLPSAEGQPGFIGSPISWVAHLIEPRVALFNACAATLEVLIGAGLLCRRTVRPALCVSFVWAAGVWFGGEGLGMLFTGAASPLTGAPGAALLYVIAGLMCWPGSRGQGPVGDRSARLAWGALWIGSAVLWLFPGQHAIEDAIASAPSGAGWLTRILETASTATAGRGTTIAIALAAASAAIALAVVCGWHARAFLALALALSLLYWVLGQGLGGIFTGQATDLGSGPPMILIASMLIRRPARGRGRARLHVPVLVPPTGRWRADAP